MGLFRKKRDETQRQSAAPPGSQEQTLEEMLHDYDPATTDAQPARADQALAAMSRMGRFGGSAIQSRIAAAQANTVYTENAMAQFAAMGGGAAVGSKSWVDAILHPQSDFVRQCSCAQCGAPKKRPSPTAYLYCDYCGALVDYDFRKVLGGATTLPDAGYVQWSNQVGADKRAARQAGDRVRFEQLEHEFYDSWISRSPSAVSHRVGDPVYRQAFLDFTVASSMATTFDPSMIALDAELTQAATGLVYGGGMGSMQIDPDSFWPVLDVVIRQQQAALALTAAAGVRDLDPDHTPEPVRRRVGMSAMVQGWMPYLSAEAGEQLLERTGLQGEYRLVEPTADGAMRHCGKCGHEFTALHGATVAVCDGCGHQLDVGAAEWPCGSCGGLMTLPAGTTSTTCPYCQERVDRVGR